MDKGSDARRQRHGTKGRVNKMSDDLISRKSLIEEIQSFRCSITGLRAGKGILAHAADEYRKSILKIIEDQPVAFEKEKVHSELIELRNAEVFKPDFATKHEENWSHGRYSAFLDAIRIVEKGGIE